MSGVSSKVNADNFQGEDQGTIKDGMDPTYIDLDNFKLSSDTVKVRFLCVFFFF